MNDFMKRAKELKQTTVEDRRYLHRHGEAGMSLPKTTEYVMKRLKEIGLEPREICPSAVVATLEGGKPGRTILLRADMDALPMEEHNDLPYKTETGAAHTCGHDMHTAMLLTAAAMLYENRDQLEGNVKFMFQPGEEVFQGSQVMIEAGLLETPHVDAAMGIHMMLDEGPGTICFGEGFMTSSCDGFQITVTGKGCHGAMPQTGVDPIQAAVHIYLGFQEVIAREVPPAETVVLTFGQLAAGSTHNIIPETAVLKGTLRTYNTELRERLLKRLHQIADLTARAYQATAQYEVLASVPPTYTDPRLLREMLGYIGQMEPDLGRIPNYRVTPSDDFAFVAEKVPSVYLMLCGKVEGNDKLHHNPGVLFHEDAMPYGAAIHAQCAMEWLHNHK